MPGAFISSQKSRFDINWPCGHVGDPHRCSKSVSSGSFRFDGLNIQETLYSCKQVILYICARSIHFLVFKSNLFVILFRRYVSHLAKFRRRGIIIDELIKEAGMELQEWLDKLKWLSDEQLIKTHFGLQEKIKQAYKLRGEGNNLKKVISLCEQQIALSPMVMKAMKELHRADWEAVSEVNRAVGRQTSMPDFYAPSHHGYRQLCVILKKQKKPEEVAKLEVQRSEEGWA